MYFRPDILSTIWTNLGPFFGNVLILIFEEIFYKVLLVLSYVCTRLGQMNKEPNLTGESEWAWI